MFQLFEKTVHSFHTPLIDSFLKILKNNNSLSPHFSHNNSAKFLLTENPTTGIFGGALLLKQKIGSLHKDIRKNLASFCPDNEVWTCAIALYMGNGANVELVCKNFYTELYESLLEFSLTEKINFLCMTLDPGEYLCTEAIGFWPYVVEIRPQESSDGLFHGILSLSYSQSKKLAA